MTQIQQTERASLRSQEEVMKRRTGKAAKEIELQSLKVERVDPKRLQPNPYNPNKQDEHEFDLLCQSIRADGFTMPVLANMDYTIIDGEHRWRAALKIGLKTIPVVRLDLDEARMKIATIRHNKATGSHDAGLEALVLADLEKMVGAGFIESQLLMDQKELQEILRFTNAPDMLAGKEFSPSWEPVRKDSVYETDDAGKPVASPVFKARMTIDSAVVLRSPTSDANTLAFNKLVNGDKSAGYKTLFTVSAVVSPEEAIRVQQVLENPEIAGSTPAERLLTLARQKHPKIQNEVEKEA